MKFSFTVHLLGFTLFLAFVALAAAQSARDNGEDDEQLTPVEPGTRTFRRRFRERCDSFDFRTIDGSCTNDRDPVAGSFSTPHFSYRKRLSSRFPTGQTRPSPRLISNRVCKQDGDVFNDRGLSEFIVFFAQFLDHTIVATTTNPDESMDIEIPESDDIFANFSGFLHFDRSVRAQVTRANGRPLGSVVRPTNVITSATDLSSVYGSEVGRMNNLRVHARGLMRTSDGDLPPFNRFGLFNAPNAERTFYLAGDHRANEHPVLTAFHTLWLREHNTLARELAAAFPGRARDDEWLFQTARLVNGAQFQKVLYEEFLPTLTGRDLPRYRGYRSRENPQVSIEFSTAAYRIGHTMVANRITRRGKNMAPLPNIEMKDIFFRTGDVQDDGIEVFLRGAIFAQAQEIDTKIVDALRNFLFTRVADEEGFDLIALNLQRGRDHAVPSYATLRRKFRSGREKRVRRFSDITSNLVVQSQLANAYSSVKEVDAFIGLIAEDHMPGSSLGPTMFAIWEREFTRLRDADRFFYQQPGLFEPSVLRGFPRLREMLAETDTMRQIVLRNTDITDDEIGRSVWLSKQAGGGTGPDPVDDMGGDGGDGDEEVDEEDMDAETTSEE